MIDPLYSLSGFAVGLLVGMTGVGGGSLMTPILILLFGVHPAIRPGARQSDRGGLSRAWVNSIPSAPPGIRFSSASSSGRLYRSLRSEPVRSA